MGTFFGNFDPRVVHPSEIERTYFEFQIYKKKGERNLELICNVLLYLKAALFFNSPSRLFRIFLMSCPSIAYMW